METQLLPGTKLNNRYQIVKTVIWRTCGGVYEAWDFKITEKKWLVKEVIPPKMPEKELLERREYFYETLETLRNLSHPNLARIIDFFTENQREYVVIEYIEGITFEYFIGVISRLREKQALEIGLELCDAIEYLNNRPKPVVFENLDLEHVMLDYDKKLKFVGYELTKFFTDSFPYTAFADSPEHIETSVYNISKIIFFLLSGIEDADEGSFPDNISISPELQEMLERTLSPHQKAYSSIKNFKEDLEKLYNPEKFEKIEEEKRQIRKAREIKIPTLSWINEIPGKIAAAFLGQKSYMFIIEAAAVVLFVLIFFAFYQNPKSSVYKRPDGPVAYIGAPGELNVIAPDETSMYYSSQAGGNPTILYSAVLNMTVGQNESPEDVNVIIAGYEGRKTLDIIDSNTLERLGTIDSDPGPTKVVADRDGKYIYILSPKVVMVSVIDVAGKSRANVIPTGTDPVDIAYIPVEKEEYKVQQNIFLCKCVCLGQMVYIQVHNLPVSERAKLECGVVPSPGLAVSNAGSNDVYIVNPDSGEFIKRIKISGHPGALAASNDGKILFVSDTQNHGILAFETKGYNLINTISLEDKVATELLMDPEKDELWVCMKDSNLIMSVDPATCKILRTKPVVNKPSKILIDHYKELLWVLNEGTKDINAIDLNTLELKRKYQIHKIPLSICVEKNAGRRSK